MIWSNTQRCYCIYCTMRMIVTFQHLCDGIRLNLICKILICKIFHSILFLINQQEMLPCYFAMTFIAMSENVQNFIFEALIKILYKFWLWIPNRGCYCCPLKLLNSGKCFILHIYSCSYVTTLFKIIPMI